MRRFGFFIGLALLATNLAELRSPLALYKSVRPALPGIGHMETFRSMSNFIYSRMDSASRVHAVRGISRTSPANASPWEEVRMSERVAHR